MPLDLPQEPPENPTLPVFPPASVPLDPTLPFEPTGTPFPNFPPFTGFPGFPTLPFVPTAGGGSGGGATTVNIVINDNLTFAQDAFDHVAAAIKDALDGAAQSASNIAKETSKTIVDSIGGLTNSLVGGIKDALGSLADWIKTGVKSILDNAGEFIKLIADNLGSAVKEVLNRVTEIMKPLIATIDKIATTIQDINDRFIQPITKLINDTLQTISTLTTAIEKDLHSGLSGILQIPSDIAGAMTSLDATLQRTVQQIGIFNKEVVNVDFRKVLDATVSEHLKKLGSTLSSKGGGTWTDTTFHNMVPLPEPDVAGAGAKTFDAIWNDIMTFLRDLFKFGQPSLDALKTLPIAIPFIVGETIEFPVLLLGLGIAFVEAMEPLLEFIKDDIAAKAGIGKLGAGDALGAWVRGFINEKDLEEELAINGWNKERIEVMKDLRIALLDVSTTVDMYFRGITSESDMRLNMTSHGIVKDQQDALIKQSFALMSPDLALKAWRYGIIDDDALKTVYRINRSSDDGISLHLQTALQPEFAADVIERHKRDTLFSSHLTNDAVFSTVPGDVVDAAKHQGADKQVAFDMWRRQFDVPPLRHWIELYFRGIRTHRELMAAMDYYRVPAEWRDDYIRANQSLIPFRTIPRMLSLGVIDEAYAKQQLQAHGFDLTATEALLKLAASVTGAAKKKSSGDLHAISVGTAKTFWELGALTDDQYHDILIAHGYDEASAKLTLQVEGLHAHAKERKQIATDLVNEVIAGLVTFDQANEQMSAHQFTSEERARVLRSISRTQRQAAKLPSESEMRQMVTKGVMDVQEYVSGLRLLGFSDLWADRFVKLHFLSLVKP